MTTKKSVHSVSTNSHKEKVSSLIKVCQQDKLTSAKAVISCLYITSGIWDMACNIDQTDRINRACLGALLIVSALLNFSELFYLVVGIILIGQAYIGWCSIPAILGRFKTKKKKKKWSIHVSDLAECITGSRAMMMAALWLKSWSIWQVWPT